MDGDAPALLNVRDTARLLGVHENTVRNWAKTGQLPEARIPGSRFHRFLLEDVERLKTQRGAAAPTLKQQRLAVSPELVTAGDLKRWAEDNSRDAQGNLPELVRRLLVETPNITAVSMRSGDGVALGGWDGVAESRGSAFLPAGSLVFELGVRRRSIKSKATEDYESRVPMARADQTFVFVTAQRWADKEVWAHERRGEKHFADVKVLDADDLEGWLEASPAAHFWISEHLGRKPQHAQTIDTWWERFSAESDPPLPANLFLAGRLAPAHTLQQRLKGDPVLTTIQSEWLKDCLAFVFASLKSDDPAGTDERTTVIISAADVWDRVVREPGQAILIPLFEGADVGAALDSGHHVISVLDRASVARRGVDINLARVERRAATQALESVGVDFRLADRMATLGRRSLPALQRSIARNPKLKVPGWGAGPDAVSLATLVLTGAWTTSESDLAALQQLTGQGRQDLERVIRSVSGTSDPVLRKVSGTWMVVSPEEAFLYLRQSLGEDDLDKWAQAARQILVEPDPTLDLSAEERLAAQMEGVRRQYSQALTRGVAQGLALMGVMGSTRTLDDNSTITEVAARVISRLLADANSDTSGRQWRLLAAVLPLLAEAAPEEFLAAVEEDLDRPHPVMLELFREDDDGLTLGSSSLHPYLLWSLETVCWADEYLVDGIRALARLADVEPGGKLSNRPSSSLSTILCGWIRNTSATKETRLRATDEVFRTSERIGWQLLLDLWPSNHGWVSPPAAPRLRDDWQPADRSVSMQEWAEFAHELVERAIVHADGDSARLTELVEKLPPLPARDRDRIIDFIDAQAESGHLSHEGRLQLWDKVQSVVRRHERFKTADWAMPDEALRRLNDLAGRIEPTDDPQRFSYLFGWHPDLPGVERADFDEYSKHLAKNRASAIESILGSDGWLEQLASIARRAPSPTQVGWALSEVKAVEISSLISWLACDEASLREAAATFVGRRLAFAGVAALKEALRLRDLVGPARDLLLQCVPASGEYWDALDESPESGDAARYWQTARVDAVPNPDVKRAIANLIAHGRAWSAIEVASHAMSRSTRQTGHPTFKLETPTIVELLDHALNSQPSEAEVSQMDGYYLGELLDYLVDKNAPDSDIARFEFAFYRLLEHHRQPVILSRALASEPELFVDLVKRVYRGKHEPRREKSEGENALASHAWWVLHGWTGFPGRAEDGTVDAQVLSTWVREARLQLSDVDRADIGDEVIGESFGHSPVGLDGAWPAEPIRDLIESIGSRELENGLVIGRMNSRGVTTRDVFEGGQQERTLAQQYLEWSKATKSQWPRTARALRAISESYESHARRQDAEAELDADQF